MITRAAVSDTDMTHLLLFLELEQFLLDNPRVVRGHLALLQLSPLLSLRLLGPHGRLLLLGLLGGNQGGGCGHHLVNTLVTRLQPRPRPAHAASPAAVSTGCLTPSPLALLTFLENVENLLLKIFNLTAFYSKKVSSSLHFGNLYRLQMSLMT